MIKNIMAEIGAFFSYLSPGFIPATLGTGLNIFKNKLSLRESIIAILSTGILLYSCGNTILKTIDEDLQAFAFVILGYCSTVVLDFVLDNAWYVALDFIKLQFSKHGIELHFKSEKNHEIPKKPCTPNVV